MEKMFLHLHGNLKHESIKHACFHVNFPFSAYFYPHYILMVSELISSWSSTAAANCHTSGARNAGQVIEATVLRVCAHSQPMRGPVRQPQPGDASPCLSDWGDLWMEWHKPGGSAHRCPWGGGEGREGEREKGRGRGERGGGGGERGRRGGGGESEGEGEGRGGEREESAIKVYTLEKSLLLNSFTKLSEFVILT